LPLASAAKSALGAKVRFSLDKFSMESDVMCMRLPLERLSVKCRDLSTVSHI
jgi:hypothetical protein